MKLSTTRALFAYWNELRGGRVAPDRDDIEPGAIRGCLAHTFVLAFDPRQGHPFRLAGTAVCSLFGRELKGQAFRALWSPASGIAALSDVLAEEKAGAVASVTGRNREAESVALEMILLPLGCSGRVPARLLGSLAPVTQPYWLGTRLLADFALGDLRYVGPAIEPLAPPPFVAGGRDPLRGSGFTFYPGSGGASPPIAHDGASSPITHDYDG